METARPTWRSHAWLVAAALVMVLVATLGLIGFDRPTSAWVALAVAGAAAGFVVGWAISRTRRERRHYEEELAAWAEERARHAERLRIAADLHDLVSHGLGVITVRAAVARTLAGPEGDVERAQALADVERISRETTTELRRMLTVLLDANAASLRPADTLDDLVPITQQADAAGLRTVLHVEPLGEVSAGVQLTICAVVREGLSNTLRHAGPTEVHVRVQREGDVIVVEVEDAGPRGAWQPRPGAGHGLRGLRERVTTLGGTFRAIPTGQGFRVSARVPDAERP
jgi:two-component system sensor histidine kinase DesK